MGVGRNLARIARLALLLLAVGCITGCMPSRVLSHALVKAPNQQPFYPARKVAGHWNHLTMSPKSPFRSHRIAVGPPEAEITFLELPPADYHMQVDSELFTTNGAKHLNVKFKFSGEKPGRVEERGAVFLLHGYMTSKEMMIPWAFALAKAGYRTVLVDIRGHGSSTGDSFSFGKNETSDMVSVLNHCEAMGICRGPVGVLGMSFGANLGLHWMAADSRVGTVVAIAPYDEMSAVLERFIRQNKIPLSAGTQRRALERAAARLESSIENWSGSAAVRGLTRPVLFVSAGEDKISTTEEIEAMSKLAPLGSQHVRIQAASHDAIAFWFHELKEPVIEWFQSQPVEAAAGR